MKKIFPVILSLGMLLILFSSFHTAGGASGAAQSPSIGGEEQNEIERDDTPWLDEAWHYRRTVNIANNGAYLSYYQALIKLENSKFDFAHAKSDGSDIRFTGSDGTTELNYWVESWRNPDPQVAYIWVRVFPLVNGSNTIYLYYGHDQPVVTHSDGVKTFDGFDDNWNNITPLGFTPLSNAIKNDTSNNIETLLTWSTISGTPIVSQDGYLILDDEEGIRSNNVYHYQAVGFKAIYNSGNENVLGGFFDCSATQDCSNRQRTVIGDLNNTDDDPSLINYAYGPLAYMSIEGLSDWHTTFHIYEIRWNSVLSEGDVDHKPPIADLDIQVPTNWLPITFYSISGSNEALKVDWVYLRRYQKPEPIASVGDEQGLVDLATEIADSPDPLNISKELTYLLTISNYSSIDAPSVIVTDTLDGSATFISANAPLGCSHIGLNVICNVGTITANSSINATIKVNPTVDGLIPNSAVVGSPGYDPNSTNNYDEVTTQVDSVPPTVEWIEPTTDGNIYFTAGGWITLRAFAEDTSGISNSGVAYVEFWRYTPDPLKIATVDLSPYQLQFNSDDLVPNQPWPFEVFAFDRAGNRSAVEPPGLRQVIYIERIFRYLQYLPFIKR
jgi:uncharacterized repeat protein (TIGR01451 family)